MPDEEINNVEEKKPFYKQKKGIIGIVVVCCIGVLILAVIGGMLSPDSLSNNNSSSNSGSSSDGVYKDGTYKVGTDLEAGEYKFTQTSSIAGYVERASDSSMEVGSIIANDVTSNQGETKYITVNDGEYVKVQGGELTKA